MLHTGQIGDGKVFVYDIENVVKIRTGEEGYLALQDTSERVKKLKKRPSKKDGLFLLTRKIEIAIIPNINERTKRSYLEVKLSK